MQVACSHHGKLVTEVIDACEIERFFRGRETLQDATLAQVPLASGKGNRTGLDEVIELLGFSRSELEAELSTEFHSRNA